MSWVKLGKGQIYWINILGECYEWKKEHWVEQVSLR